MVNFLFIIIHTVALYFYWGLLIFTLPLHLIYSGSRKNREKLERTLKEISDKQNKIAEGMTSEEYEQEKLEKLNQLEVKRKREFRTTVGFFGFIILVLVIAQYAMTNLV